MTVPYKLKWQKVTKTSLMVPDDFGPWALADVYHLGNQAHRIVCKKRTADIGEQAQVYYDFTGTEEEALTKAEAHLRALGHEFETEPRT